MLLELLDFFIHISVYTDTEEDDFWEPVRVGLKTSQVQKFSNVESFNECPICTVTRERSKRLPCCKKTMCFECTRKWFASSVKCPFCMRDLRDYESQASNEKEKDSSRA